MAYLGFSQVELYAKVGQGQIVCETWTERNCKRSWTILEMKLGQGQNVNKAGTGPDRTQRWDRARLCLNTARLDRARPYKKLYIAKLSTGSLVGPG